MIGLHALAILLHIIPQQTTNVDGGVHGTVLSGDFQGTVDVHEGGHGGNVYITMGSDPPQPQNTKQYIEAMWKILLEEQRQRYLRQKETDKHRQCMLQWLTALTILTIAMVIVMIAWMVQWTSRFGWFW